MNHDRCPSRRAILRAGGLGALSMGALALAGCGASSSPAAITTSPAGTTTPAGSATPTAAAGSTTAATSAAASSASGTEVTKLSGVPVGGTASATLDGKPILLSQSSAGQVEAYSAICPHQGATVAADGAMFKCPRHGSEFKAADGSVIQGPATSGLTKLTAAVSDGAVLVTG